MNLTQITILSKFSKHKRRKKSQQLLIPNSDDDEEVKNYSQFLQFTHIKQLPNNVSQGYQMLIKTYFKYNTLQTRIDFYFIKNANLLSIQQYILLCRYFNNINSSIKYGHFRIDSSTKTIKFSILNILTKSELRCLYGQDYKEENIYSPQNIKKYLINEQKIGYNLIAQHFLPILQRVSQYGNQKEIQSEMKRISTIQKQLYLQKQINESNKKYLIRPNVLSNQLDKTSIYSQIILIDTKQIKKLKQNKQEKICVKKANFIYADNPNIQWQKTQYNLDQVPQKQILSRRIAVKQQMFPKGGDLDRVDKIQYQKQLLNTIKDLSCAHIIRYYNSKQPSFQSSIIMDFSPNFSLDHYKNNHSRTMSLMTKIYVICQVIQGLRFLRDHHIVHFNLKLLNIMIFKKLISKVRNFAQSYHPDIYNADFKARQKIRFVDPKVFQKNQQFNQKSDVYSLGMMMHQMFFEFLPTESQQWQSVKKKKKIQLQEITQLRLNDNGINVIRQSQIIKLLHKICIICINIEQNMRPPLDWIMVSLRVILDVMGKIYY